MALTITSSAFEDRGPMAAKYTCEGSDISPPLQWNGVPEGTRSLALISRRSPLVPSVIQKVRTALGTRRGGSGLTTV